MNLESHQTNIKMNWNKYHGAPFTAIMVDDYGDEIEVEGHISIVDVEGRLPDTYLNRDFKRVYLCQDEKSGDHMLGMDMFGHEYSWVVHPRVLQNQPDEENDVLEITIKIKKRITYDKCK